MVDTAASVRGVDRAGTGESSTPLPLPLTLLPLTVAGDASVAGDELALPWLSPASRRRSRSFVTDSACSRVAPAGGRNKQHQVVTVRQFSAPSAS